MQRVLEEGTGVHVVDRVIIADCGAVCHTAAYAYGKLTNGTVYGFFSLVYSMAFSHECGRLAFCWDSQRSKRRELYSQYKANRVKTEETIERYKDFDLIRKELLPRLGFKNSFIQDGYEADDLIASICRNNKGKKFIASHDHDLFQLLDRDTCIVKPNSSCQKFTLDIFKDKYGIEPEDWVMVKAMAGCSTDNIGGIPNVGEIRAVKHLRGKYQYQCTGREAERIIRRNLRLVRLPMKGTKDVVLHEEEHLDFKEFQKLCEEYHFKKFINNYGNWEKFFAGEPPPRRQVKRVPANNMPTLGLV